MEQTVALHESVGAAVSFPYLLRRPLILFVVFLSAAMAALSFWRTPEQRPGGMSRYAGRPVLAIGRVVGYPVGNAAGDSFLLSVRWVQPPGSPAFRSDERIGVIRKNPHTPFTWGDEVSVWGPLMPVDPNRHNQRGVAGRLFVPEGRSVLLQRASPLSPVRWAASLRDRFHAAFNKYLPESSAQLLSGVLLGDRPPGLAAFAADFRRSGTFHLLVASGSNVGFALGVWWVFARWVLWWPRRWTIAGAPFVAFLYALMAGGDPPVLRAAVMAAVGSVGALLGRWDRLEHPLILSAGLLLLWNPNSLFHAGFQMSYAATMAIAVVWGNNRNADEEPSAKSIVGPRAVARVGKWAWELFVTSLAAQIALAPLLLYYFGRFSWVGIGANMVAVPLSGVCLILGAGLTFLASVWPAAASLWAVPTRWGAEALAQWARLCAKIPGAEWHQVINGNQAVVLGVGVVLGFTVLSLNLEFPVGPGIRRRISHFFPLWGRGLLDPSQTGATGAWDPQKVRPMSLHRPLFFRPKKWISFVSVLRANWEFQVNTHSSFRHDCGRPVAALPAPGASEPLMRNPEEKQGLSLSHLWIPAKNAPGRRRVGRRMTILSVVALFTLGSFLALATPAASPALSISWVGGRSAAVRIQTRAGATVFEKGEDVRPSFLADAVRRVQWDAEGGWGTDGARWADGPTLWEVIRPNSGKGFALLLRSGKTKALLNFGLTARQQADWIQRAPGPVDLLSWTGGKGGPPEEALLTLLRPRWIVYQGTRIPIAVRQSGSTVYRPRRNGLHWEAKDMGAGFCPTVQN